MSILILCYIDIQMVQAEQSPGSGGHLNKGIVKPQETIADRLPVVDTSTAPPKMRVARDSKEVAARKELHQELFAEAMDSDDQETRRRLDLLKKYGALEWRAAKMYYGDKLQRAEIAERLGVSGGGVWNLLVRFRIGVMDVSPESETERREKIRFEHKLDRLKKREKRENRPRPAIVSPDSDLDDTAEVGGFHVAVEDPQAEAVQLPSHQSDVIDELLRTWGNQPPDLNHLPSAWRQRLKKAIDPDISALRLTSLLLAELPLRLIRRLNPRLKRIEVPKAELESLGAEKDRLFPFTREGERWRRYHHIDLTVT